MSGIYVHIPFCRSRCAYCGFYSTTLLNLRQQYVDAVCKEIELRKDYLKGRFSTIYIGGGTPSMLTVDELSTLLHYIYKVYDIDAEAEVTIECNPDDVTPDFAEAIGHMPVNRISMGAQTFDDERLKFIRRRHSSDEICLAVERLRQAGISNISIDLMFGFPEETMQQWQTDIEKALALDVEHISAYSLMYEEGTPLTAMLEKGDVKEIDEELSNAMYDELVSRLTNAGYEHYEISNFARPGFRSRHNSSYWHQTAYIGLGAAAHSFDIKSRQWNVDDISTYITEINKGNVPMERETLDRATSYNDIVTTALRTCEGIDLEKLAQQLGKEYSETLITSSKDFIDKGLLKLHDGHIRLTHKGIFISDTIMSELMIV